MQRLGESPKAARVVLTYALARVGTTLLTGGAFFVIFMVIGLGITGSLTTDVLQLQHARFMLAIGLVFAALFAGHGGSIALLDAYSQGRFRLPSDLDPPPTAAVARNPWRIALQSAAFVGVPLSLLAFCALPSVMPHGIAREQFAFYFALIGSWVGGAVVWVLGGRAFLEEAQLAPAQRSFTGSHAAYLWQRHAAPQAIINAIINGWVGIALVPGAMHQDVARVPAALVLADAGGTAFVLVIAIAIGEATYARFDLRWGVIAPIDVARPRLLVRLAALFGSALLMVLLVRGLYAGLRLDAISGWAFVVWRSLACGLYCGAVGYWVARWNLSVRKPPLAYAAVAQSAER